MSLNDHLRMEAHAQHAPVMHIPAHHKYQVVCVTVCVCVPTSSLSLSPSLSLSLSLYPFPFLYFSLSSLFSLSLLSSLFSLSLSLNGGKNKGLFFEARLLTLSKVLRAPPLALLSFE